MNNDVVLAQAKELTSLARSTWLTLLVACLYSWLVIAAQTDDVLLVNGVSVELPILGTMVTPLAYNAVAAPILLALTAYLHVLIVRLFLLYSRIPSLDAGLYRSERVQPWILISFLNGDRLPYGIRWISLMAALLLVWVLPPLTLLILGGRYPVGVWWLVLIQAVCVWGAVLVSGISLWWVSRPLTDLRDPRTAAHPLPRLLLAWVALGAALTILISVLSDRRAFNIAEFANRCLTIERTALSHLPEDWTALDDALTEAVGARCVAMPFAVPDSRGGVRESEDAAGFRVDGEVACRNGFFGFDADRRELLRQIRATPIPQGAVSCLTLDVRRAHNLDLSDRDLRNVVFGRPPDSNASESGAIFNSPAGVADAAGSRVSDLGGLNLEGAQLTGSDLRGVDLAGVSMPFADLAGANLAGADLGAVDLRFARLADADLSGAMLWDADLEFAMLSAGGAGDVLLPMEGAVLLGTRTRGVFSPAQTLFLSLEGAYLNGAFNRQAEALSEPLIEQAISNRYLPPRNALSVEYLLNEGVIGMAGAALRFVDLQGPNGHNAGQIQDLEAAFGDGSVRMAKRFGTPQAAPCHWPDRLVGDVEFFGRWRGWLESGGKPWPPSEAVGNLRVRQVEVSLTLDDPQGRPGAMPEYYRHVMGTETSEPAPPDGLPVRSLPMLASSVTILRTDTIPAAEVPPIPPPGACKTLAEVLAE